MDIPYNIWYDAISLRRSRRRYLPKPVDQGLLARFAKSCDEFVPFSGARTVLVERSPEDVLKGIIGHYGKIKGAPAFVGIVGNMDDPHVQEQAGYTGEGIILEAASLGLGTCWVGGFFRPDVAASIIGISGNEKVLAITPLGYTAEKWAVEEKVMSGFGRSHRRKPLAELVAGMDEEKRPSWMEAALQAARLAPSALNRQPWRFHVTPDSITVLVDDLRDTYGISKRLDCGIAMLHVEVASRKQGVSGTWEFQDAPKVARWKVGGSHLTTGDRMS